MSDSNAYRSKDEERQWLERDPLKIYGERLKKAGIVTDKDIAAMEKSVLDEIENDIVRFAEESPEPRIEDLNKYCLDDQPDPRWIGPLAQGEQHG